jgi:hypothetical protein
LGIIDGGGFKMRNILKVFIWAIVAAGAVALWLAGLYVPQIEPFGFPLGIVYSIAIFSLMEGADKLRRQGKGGTRWSSDKQEAHKK